MTLLFQPQPILAEGTSFWSLVSTSVRASGAIENAILLILLICSIASWAIVLWKLKVLRAARAGNAQLDRAFSESDAPSDLAARLDKLIPSPNVLICAAAVRTLEANARTSNPRQLDPTPQGNGSELPVSLKGSRGFEERVQLKMEHASRMEFARAHRGMDILASIASATPFIGLLGTVLGIMSTFQVLGTAKSASLNVVAPGIAAALIATAAGLAVAIPAVFLYNWLMARMDELQEQADMFVETLGQWLLATGVFTHAPNRANGVGHEASEPVIVGQGAHVAGSTE